MNERLAKLNDQAFDPDRAVPAGATRVLASRGGRVHPDHDAETKQADPEFVAAAKSVGLSPEDARRLTELFRR
jgi:hypothetical protein